MYLRIMNYMNIKVDSFNKLYLFEKMKNYILNLLYFLQYYFYSLNNNWKTIR